MQRKALIVTTQRTLLDGSAVLATSVVPPDDVRYPSLLKAAYRRQSLFGEPVAFAEPDEPELVKIASRPKGLFGFAPGMAQQHEAKEQAYDAKHTQMSSSTPPGMHWITIHPNNAGEGHGRPVLVDDNSGKIEAGLPPKVMEQINNHETGSRTPTPTPAPHDEGDYLNPQPGQPPAPGGEQVPQDMAGEPPAPVPLQRQEPGPIPTAPPEPAPLPAPAPETAAPESPPPAAPQPPVAEPAPSAGAPEPAQAPEPVGGDVAPSPAESGPETPQEVGSGAPNEASPSPESGAPETSTPQTENPPEATTPEPESPTPQTENPGEEPNLLTPSESEEPAPPHEGHLAHAAILRDRAASAPTPEGATAYHKAADTLEDIARNPDSLDQHILAHRQAKDRIFGQGGSGEITPAFDRPFGSQEFDEVKGRVKSIAGSRFNGKKFNPDGDNTWRLPAGQLHNAIGALPEFSVNPRLLTESTDMVHRGLMAGSEEDFGGRQEPDKPTGEGRAGELPPPGTNPADAMAATNVAPPDADLPPEAMEPMDTAGGAIFNDQAELATLPDDDVPWSAAAVAKMKPAGENSAVSDSDALSQYAKELHGRAERLFGQAKNETTRTASEKIKQSGYKLRGLAYDAEEYAQDPRALSKALDRYGYRPPYNKFLLTDGRVSFHQYGGIEADNKYDNNGKKTGNPTLDKLRSLPGFKNELAERGHVSFSPSQLSTAVEHFPSHYVHPDVLVEAARQFARSNAPPPAWEHPPDLKTAAEGGRTLFPFQQYNAALCAHRDRSILSMDMGLGKALPLSAGILTPTGWKRMGDIQVGDAVIGSQGTPVYVTGVFPQGQLEAFEIEFTDGSVSICSDDHLWYTESPKQRWLGRSGKVRTLAEIRARLADTEGNLQHFIPMVRPVQFEGGALPLDPYFLGLLIGDGCFGKNAVSFSTADAELLHAVEQALPEGVRATHSGGYDYRLSTAGPRNPLIHALKSLGIYRCSSLHKWIPDQYRFASLADRVALLQGLLDTDGCVREKDNNIEFATSSERLARDMRELVQSLGGTARIRSRIPRYIYKRNRLDGACSYRMSVRLPAGIDPFRLSRKASIYAPSIKYAPARAFKQVTPIGPLPMQCIAVDAPDKLFVVDDCVVTHNTLTSLAAFSRRRQMGMSKKCLAIVPVATMHNWSKEVKANTHLKVAVAMNQSDLTPDGKQSPEDEHTQEELLRDADIVVAGYSGMNDTTTRDKVMKEIKTRQDEQKFHYEQMKTAREIGDEKGMRQSEAHVARLEKEIAAQGNPEDASDEDSKLDALMKLGSDSLIIDEAHRLKNPQSKASKAFMEHLQGMPHMQLLTGTPMHNKPQNLHQMIQMVSPNLFGKLPQFVARYVNQREGAQGRSVDVGYKNLDELFHLAKPAMSYLPAGDPHVMQQMAGAGLSIPERTDMSRDVTMSPAQSKLYDMFREAGTQILSDMQSASEEGEGATAKEKKELLITLGLRMAQITHDPRLLDLSKIPNSEALEEAGGGRAIRQLVNQYASETGGVSPKVAQTADIISDHLTNGGKGAVVYTSYPNGPDLVDRSSGKVTKQKDFHLKLIRDGIIKRGGYKPSEVGVLTTGSPTARQKLIDRYNDPKDPMRIMLITPAANEGVNLQGLRDNPGGGGDLFVRLNREWLYGAEDQADARISRLGQDRPTTHVALHAVTEEGRPTSDHKMAARINQKRKVGDKVLENKGESNEIAVDSGFDVKGKEQSGAGFDMDDLTDLFGGR